MKDVYETLSMKTAPLGAVLVKAFRCEFSPAEIPARP